MFTNKIKTLYLAIYVDDGILITKCENELISLLDNLRTEFEMKISKNCKKFLSIEIDKQQGKITLNQRNYIQTILEKFNMQNAKRVPTPMVVQNGES